MSLYKGEFDGDGSSWEWIVAPGKSEGHGVSCCSGSTEEEEEDELEAAVEVELLSSELDTGEVDSDMVVAVPFVLNGCRVFVGDACMSILVLPVMFRFEVLYMSRRKRWIASSFTCFSDGGGVTSLSLYLVTWLVMSSISSIVILLGSMRR